MQIFLVFILLNVLPTFSIESSSEYLNSRKYLLNRNKRADGAMNQILEKHLPLGRVFNALYLQMELNDKKIDGSDVVAGVLNLKNKASLEKLVSLKVDGVADELKTVEQAVQAVPDGIKQIADVDTIADKFKLVSEINETMRQELVAAKNIENIPSFINNGDTLGTISSLSENLAEKVLTIINSIKSYTDVRKLTQPIDNCKIALSQLPKELNNLVNETVKSLNILLNGVEVGSKISGRTEDFKNLIDLLSKAELEKRKIASLKNIQSVQTVKFLNATSLSLKEALHISNQIPIASAFVSGSNLSEVNLDLQNKWLKSLLNKHGDLEKLSHFGTINELSNGIDGIRNFGKQVFTLDHLDDFGYFIDYMAKIEKYVADFQPLEIESFEHCLDYSRLKRPDVSNEMKDLAAKLDAFYNVIPHIQSEVNKVNDISLLIGEIRKHTPDSSLIDRDNFNEWKNGEGFSDMKKFFEELKKTFEPLKQNQSFIDDVKTLSNVGPKIKKVQDWISNITLAEKGCDIVYHLNVEKLRNMNNAPSTIYSIRSGGNIKKVQDFIENFPKLKTNLEKFKTAMARSNKEPSGGVGPTAQPPKGKTKRETKSIKDLKLERQSLLEVAYATRSLEQMKRIEEKSSDFQTVFLKGEDAVKAIPYVKDAEKKSKLEAVWKDFPNFKKDLESFKTSNSKAVASLKYVPEKNLKDVGNVYMNITVFKFSRQAELRGMRETMRYFDNPIPSLIDALASIEELLAMDWGLVHTNFQKVPNSLIGLQNDFLEFFRVEKKVEPNTKEKAPGGLNLFLLIGVGFGVLVLIAIIVLVILYCVFVHDSDLKKSPPVEPDYSPPEEKFFEFTYMQVQDARLEMNKRDKKYIGNTPLFNAVIRDDWPAAEKMIKQGVVLDATCAGPLCRTVLFEAVLKQKQSFCKKLLKAAADQTICDATGDDPDTWTDRFNMTDLFQYFYDERKLKAPPRIVPSVKRYWKVLVLDKSCFKFYKKKKLPKRIKNHITWGYNEDMDLDSFSHIVLPNEYVKKDVTLLLDEKDFLTFQLLGCWANLMSVKWLNALANKEIHEKAMNRDFEYYVMHTEYRGNHHERTVFKQKTSIHKLQPRLLMNVAVTLLPTKLPYWKDQTKELKALVEQFGGELPNEVIMDDDDNCPLPYYSMDIDNLSSQNRCWVLKFEDSKGVNPEWKKWPDRCTVSDIQLLFECIARWKVLEHSNSIVVPEEIAPEPEIVPGTDGKSKMVNTQKPASKTAGKSQFKNLKERKSKMVKKIEKRS
ncbi:hypothetical protein GCK72_006929 [Caenorhabditis remanei]|uniref:Domain of unknown function WSN domain-containing protein n=1 Tax=Caenorhabditis remanei TaxID=31234 RepID=A0A6A5HIM2_CAERE|nr:hypothetical protein GCK72_006929 [Caenorhabditis remanei]KAF1766971.1 hypothetical protein GCK72_006929 [Caenorhabditis remanei]